MIDAPSSVVVVVPARNEEQRLGVCLGALSTAVDRLQEVSALLTVRVVVVLDRCTDRSLDVVARWPAVDVVVTGHGRVGAARAAGVAHAVAGTEMDSLWICNTDADSEVPDDWLLTHFRYARAGVELLLGMVRPNFDEGADPLLLAWHGHHDFIAGHRHIHGANLGVRGSAYAAAGGFPDVAVHEDVLLADAVRRLGRRVVSTHVSPVLTSARLSGRTPGGMAGYLRELSMPARAIVPSSSS